MRLPVSIAAVLLIAAPASAETVQDGQVWLNASVFGSFSKKIAYFVEVQPRFSDSGSRLDQLILRPAIGWKITKRLTVYQGYAHVVLPTDGGSDRNEERSFQQATWIMPTRGRGEIQSRTRFEQRFRSDGRQAGFRVREMLRGELAFSRSGKGIAALGSIEGFVALNDTDWGARSGFDQVRTFAGFEIPVQGKSTVEAGYMNQTINQPAGRFRMNHIASISLFVRP